METEQAPLTTDDYAALHAMQMSSDASARAQAASLTNKLTSEERQAFGDFQRTENTGRGELNRVDNSVAGMPPEFAALSALAIGRAIGAPALSAASRALAGVKAAAGQAAPVLKYEATRSALEAVGVPKALAVTAALFVSGYKKGAKVEPAAPSGPTVQGVSVDELRAAGVGENAINATVNGRTPSASPVSPNASAPAAPASPTAAAPSASAPPPPAGSAPSPAAPPPAPTLGPDGQLVGRPGGNPDLPNQRSLNEAALAARRAAYQQRLAADSSAQMSQMTAENAASAGAYVKPAPLTKAETVAFWDYIKRGMSGADAMKNVQLQRELAARLGSPSSAEVTADMVKRYRSGEKTLAGYDKP